MAADGDDANGDCGAGDNEFGGAGGEGAGGPFVLKSADSVSGTLCFCP